MHIGTCIPCQYGNHKEHYEIIQSVPKGMMGGSRCGCKGECRDQPSTRPEMIMLKKVSERKKRGNKS